MDYKRAPVSDGNLEPLTKPRFDRDFLCTNWKSPMLGYESTNVERGKEIIRNSGFIIIAVENLKDGARKIEKAVQGRHQKGA